MKRIAAGFHSRPLLATLAALTIASAAGCAGPPKSPGAGVDIGGLAAEGGDIQEIMQRKPEARFPVRMAVARVQGVGYDGGAPCHGTGQYCLVTTREFETDDDFKRLEKLRQVSQVAPLSRMVVPNELASIKDLRVAAATSKADVLLVYTINTRFTVDDVKHKSLSIATLGFLSTKKARVDTTSSAAILDVRNGYLFGMAEGSAYDEKGASSWSTTGKLEASRAVVQQKAFQQMLSEIERVWRDAVRARRRR